MQCVSGACVAKECECTNPETCTGDADCCSDYECVNGNCVVPCVPPADGECSKDNGCCAGKICDVNGNCVDCPDGTGCAQCNGNGLGVCADTTDSPGQATCGEVTCNAVCNAVCGGVGAVGDDGRYTPSQCSNAAGGNCQDTFSELAPFPDFNGGPCCKCKTGVCGNP